MAVIAVVMIALVGAGYIGRGLVDAADDPGAGLVDRDSADQASTPLLPGSEEEPVRAVATALGPSVVVVRVGERSIGSGVVYDKGGLLLTNAHVVGSASAVTVTLNDGRSLDGEVLGADEVTDVAVVRVQPPEGVDLPAARLAGHPPQVGDLVVALGSPFGLDQTITSGVVSAVDRPVESGADVVVNMLQTDAAINPGNSGGALANRRAEVVGINSMIYSQNGDSAGVGFAIPIAKAKWVADRIVAGEPVARAYLGVRTQTVDDGSPGARVASVEDDSAAAAAGVEPDDIVVAVDGEAVKDPVDLAGAVAGHEPGDTVTLLLRRNGEQRNVPVTLGSAEASDVDPGARGRTPRSPNRPR